MSKLHNFESLALGEMASGHLFLKITERVCWDEFENLANYFLKLVGGMIIKKSDGFDLRMWTVLIEHKTLQLVFDDYPVVMSLESSDDAGDELLKCLHKSLMED